MVSYKCAAAAESGSTRAPTFSVFKMALARVSAGSYDWRLESGAPVHRSHTLILCGSHLAATIRDPRFLEQIAGQPNLGVSMVGGGGSLTGIGIRDQSQQRLDEDEGIILARSSPGTPRNPPGPAP